MHSCAFHIPEVMCCCVYGLTGAIFTEMFYINNACEKFYVNDCDQNLTFSDAFFPKTFPKCQC